MFLVLLDEGCLMRELSTFSSNAEARRLMAFLAVQAIECSVDNDDGEWVVWIHNDDDREKAAEHLNDYLQNPSDPKFENAERKVRSVLQEADRMQKEIQKKQIKLQKRWGGSWWHCYPATYIIIGLCVVVAIICTDWTNIQMSNFGVPRLCNKPDSWLMSQLDVFDSATRTDYFRARLAHSQPKVTRVEENPETKQVRLHIERPPTLTVTERHILLAQLGLNGAKSVAVRGEFWRFVGPIFIHLDCLHILFNMMWFRAMGCAIEFVRGTTKFVLLVLILAVVSNLAQVLWAGPNFGGASGVVFGLIGYVWMKGKTQPEIGIGLQHQTVVYSVLWLVLCMTGALGPIANAAHLGGFLCGIVIGARQSIWKKITFTR
ncbi:MAG: rhomboid family intramembrane serine protease [Fuerstiella sp.]